MDRFRLIYISFPYIAEVMGGVAPDTINKMGGVAVRDPAGLYAIMINRNRTEAEQIRALKHELSHLRLGHLTDGRTETTKIYFDNFDDVEREADDYADQMTDEEFSELMTYQIGAARYIDELPPRKGAKDEREGVNITRGRDRERPGIYTSEMV